MVVKINDLRSQNAIFNQSVFGRKYLPYVYTEQGIMALSGVIKNDFAVEMSIKIVRTFYSLGASLNYVGKKTFVITKVEDEIIIHSILERMGA